MMKKTLVIVVHPHLENGSVISKAWCDALEKCENVTLHKICQVYPDGKIDVEKEQALVEAHERVIFQFPLWWYGGPAMMKTWLDVVLTEGWAFGPGGDKMERIEIGAAVSCGGSEKDFFEGGPQRHTLAHYLDVFDGIAGFTRAKYIGFHAVYDTYNPETVANLDKNIKSYIEFLEK
ncbi:NAD(P)H-dependent oxidoreductase [Falsiporphyromonas endometrii]|uniref:NAD(P)H-dependent oxidoreductase n=1 Tax=Falsiporphyromonas endometrii TaxID=1387297 RepID=A0ABV9K824_9PORP